MNKPKKSLFWNKKIYWSKHVLALLCATFLCIFIIPKLIRLYKEYAGPEFCIQRDSTVMTTRDEAIALAKKSACAKEAKIVVPYGLSCNISTGTWEVYIVRNKQTEGCFSTCVVDVTTGKAEIDSRCMGLRVK